ncbi:hypothetical protein CRI94_05280 [Longibacter salinarum]|uniref:DUF2946 domain-containing protein n=1 Tax=Longibacter salinarum TaxID=1850348 RepID=A0A2A8D0D9_9BACT|nr:hypothetical protein [Longibacter salinarum]PEN14439.1 hypothetical protein CRI94_05280 [Longibacter salinarum]
MLSRLRTFGACILLLAFGLGGVVAPHVHTAQHAVESTTAAQEAIHCQDASHDATAPVATAHFHVVDVPDCVLCATTHFFSAVVADVGVATALVTKALSLFPNQHVPLIRTSGLDIRGPPAGIA